MQTQSVGIPVSISGKNLDLTAAIERHVREKVQKFERMFEDHPAVSVEVVLKTDKSGHTAEVTLFAGGFVLRGESTSPDMYYSVNQAVDRIQGQLRKFKTKLNRKLRNRSMRESWNGRSGGDGFAKLLSDLEGNGAAVETEGEEDAASVEIVRWKRFPIKPMSPEEAVLQMELLGHNFFLFTNATTFESNVVYKRKDGKYGLIEPTLE